MKVKTSRSLFGAIVLLALGFAALGCGLGSSPPPAFTGSFNTITVTDDLTQIDVCAAIPKEAIEEAMGRTLSATPSKFEYYDTGGSSGCWYEAARDSDGEAHFGYVALTPPAEYDNQPLYLDEAVSGIGDEAYFNNGADARQLWVRALGGRVAFVVAFGDIEREEACKKIATLLVAALQ
jgi:hypothetical protein